MTSSSDQPSRRRLGQRACAVLVRPLAFGTRFRWITLKLQRPSRWLLRRPKPPTSPVGEPTAHPFSADRPITAVAADLLSRDSFAVAVANSIRNWRNRDSLVIGIYGPWGVGKTSILNLIRKDLANPANSAQPLVMDFNPWEWAGHQEIAEALFADVAAAIGSSSVTGAAKLEKRVLQYAALLQFGESVVRSIAPGVRRLSGLLVLVGAAMGFLDVPAWSGATVAIAGVVGVFLAESRRIMSSLSGFLARRGGPTTSLASTKRELSCELKTFGHTLVVFVDDIDRLAPSDTVRLLQIVKANADLPGLVFVLALDRVAVATSVHAALHIDGADYLRKIVQVGFDVPRPNVLDLRDMAVAKLKPMLESPPVKLRLDEARWLDFQVNVLMPYLATPRAVVRFASMVPFSMALHIDGSECNVDPVDFLGIEVLREFEPGLYGAIRSSKGAVVGASSGDRQELDRARESVNPLLAMTDESANPRVARRLLCDLFPRAAWVDKGVGLIVDDRRELANRRIFHDRMFDRYFQFGVSRYDLSDGEITLVIAAAAVSRSQFASALQPLLQRDLIELFLTRLQAEPGRIPPGSEANVIGGLFDIGVSLKGRAAALVASESLLAEFLIELLLEPLPQEDHCRLIEDIILNAVDISLPVSFVRLQQHRLDTNRDPLLLGECLQRLAAPLLQRIEQLATQDDFDAHPHLIELLYAWSTWGGQGLTPWVERQISTREGMLKLLAALQGYGDSEFEHALARFTDLEAAQQLARDYLENPELAPAERQLLEGLVNPKPTLWRSLSRSAIDIDAPEPATGSLGDTVARDSDLDSGPDKPG